MYGSQLSAGTVARGRSETGLSLACGNSVSTVWVLSAMLVLLASGAQAGIYSGGTGTAEDPYQIGIVLDWATLSETPTDWNKHFVLIADIDFGGASLIPVGNATQAFNGIFDGGRHVLNNGIINEAYRENVGLFGRLGSACKVFDLVAGSIEVTGDVSVGGLAGRNDGAIESCYTVTTVSGDSSVGGLVGFCTGSISSCFATGTVTGTAAVGGLVGQIQYTGAVLNCYARGTVEADTSYAGGLVGLNWGAITYCYAAGLVNGTSATVGGLTALNRGTVTSSYWDVDISAISTSGGGEGRTTVEMTYPYAVNTYTGWDFTSVWVADTERTLNNGYPYLRIEVQPEENACGCCRTVGKNLNFKELVRKVFGDWLLIGASVAALAVFSFVRRQGV